MSGPCRAAPYLVSDRQADVVSSHVTQDEKRMKAHINSVCMRACVCVWPRNITT